MTLACGRLYVQYVDATAANRLPEFARAVEEEIGAAHEVRLDGLEWLARDDFRRELERILSMRAAPRRPRSSRRG